MRPLPRASVCSFCSAQLQPRVPKLRNPRVIQSTPTRSFIATPARLGLFSNKSKSTTSKSTSSQPDNPQSSHYTSNIQSFSSLERAIDTQLLQNPKKAAVEGEVLGALAACRLHAKQRIASGRIKDSRTPASDILSLSDEDKTSSLDPAVGAARKLNPAPAKPNPGDFEDLTELSYRIISHPNVFISPSVLESFVTLQSVTRDPAPIPAAFSLYATKSTISPSGRESKPNPKAAKNSVPERAALAGLESAIDTGDMATALDIIDTSYGTSAYRRSKFIRKAMPFCGIIAAAPFALWVGADQLAFWQDTVDHKVATNYAFAGLSAYAAISISLGLLAVTTANDQMVRVTWVPGTPLRERWIREEERAALDAVAMAWGFKDANKRGLEEGEEWELLREVVGRKGMILDESSLMEGMQ